MDSVNKEFMRKLKCHLFGVELAKKIQKANKTIKIDKNGNATVSCVVPQRIQLKGWRFITASNAPTK